MCTIHVLKISARPKPLPIQRKGSFSNVQNPLPTPTPQNAIAGYCFLNIQRKIEREMRDILRYTKKTHKYKSYSVCKSC